MARVLAHVTTGCVPDHEYCPTAHVTREEMPSFLARLGGLGSNPPVAHALTAQSADSAITATTVGGYAPNGLTRLAQDGHPLGLSTSAPYPAIATAHLTAPAAGYALVIGSTLPYRSTGCPCGVTLVLRQDNSVAAPLVYVDTVPTIGSTVVTVSWAFPVTAGGQTFALLGSTSTVDFYTTSLVALFIPFDGAGNPPTP